MWLDRGPAAWQTQLFACDMIALLRVANAGSAMDTQLLQEWNRPFYSQYYAVTPQRPAWYFASKDGFLYIVIDGCTTFTQGVNYVDSCGQDRQFSKITGVPHYVANVATEIWTTITELDSTTWSKILIVGHSLGGAIGQALHLLAIRSTSSAIVQSLTFGSPRAGDESFTTAMRGQPTVRLMNSLDPVPLVPPQEGLAYAVRLFTPNDQLQKWNELAHTHGGLEQDVNSDRSDNQLPGTAFMRPITSLAQWMASLPSNAATVHSILTYRDITFNYGNRVGPGSSDALPTTTMERTHSQTNYELNKEKEAAAANMQTYSHDQVSAPLRVPKQYLFRAFKLGATWCVSFQDRVITVGPGRRVAKDMANAGNRFATRMLRSGAVDTAAVLDSFLDWFGVAKQEDSGISPTIKSDV